MSADPRRYEAPPEPRDPTVAVLVFLGMVLLGLMAHFGIRGLRERDFTQDAVRTARLHSMQRGVTLAEAVVDDAAVDPRAVDWEPVPGRGPMRSVRAIARKGERRYEYLFDVDLETRVVHPRNPRAERVFREARPNP
ncbi:MAG: hypothetical protein AAF219_06480 [Myxococcota bacterium]